MKNQKRKRWLHFSYKLSTSIIISQVILALSFDAFKKKVLNKLGKNVGLLLFVKVKFINGLYKTLAPLQTLKTFNKKDINVLIDLLIDLLYFKSEEYKTIPIDTIIFSYMVVSSKEVEDIIETKQSREQHIFFLIKIKKKFFFNLSNKFLYVFTNFFSF
jgi:hypothetical protein